MERTSDVVVFVDPTCPFAWITSEWLREAERLGGPAVERRLTSLSAVNEGRDLDAWYRDYNDRAWRPARVAAALLRSAEADRWPDFYAAFGRRRHVEGLRDDTANIAATLAELALPATLAAAADSEALDDDLRGRTREACDRDAGLEGTPMLHVAGRVFFGPVLTDVPRGEQALDLWKAVSTLAGTSGFAELRTRRSEELRTS